MESGGKMRILMNHQEIDFSLENEKKAGDVIESLKKWSSERGLVFIHAIIDDQPCNLDAIPDVTIEEVSTINCIIQSKSDIVFSSADEAMDYCDRIVDFIADALQDGVEEIDKDNLENLISGTEWLTDVMTYIVHLLGIDPKTWKFRDMTLEHFLAELKVAVKELSAKPEWERAKPVLRDKGYLFSWAKSILKMFIGSDEMKKLVVESIDSPDILVESLDKITAELPLQLENLEGIAVSFQEGKDSVASENLGRFIDFLYRYTRICYQVVPVFGIDPSTIVIDEFSLEEKNRELQEELEEILEIMENDDIVSLTDLLEYEMKESLQEIEGYLKALRAAIIG